MLEQLEELIEGLEFEGSAPQPVWLIDRIVEQRRNGDERLTRELRRMELGYAPGR